VSPVFRHGRLRLYLLKLLDESPRHGYEVIRLLQDRFMGVYAPSPGTIYPRLARLEEEGLVTHDEADGRKVYRITEKGREELRSRSAELSELEEEITASVRDIAREVTEDVRETVRNLREELTFAARDMQRRGSPPPRGASRGVPRPAAPPHRRDARAASAWDEALQEQAQQDEAHQEQARHERARREWGRKEREWGRKEEAGAGPGWRGWPPGGSGWADPGTYRDLEQLARRFTRELRAAASQAQAVSEDAVGDLRSILDDTLDRIKAEVFGAADASRPGAPRPGASRPGASRPHPSQPGAPRPGVSEADAPRGENGDHGGPR
jgi:DNA-binding PadR family transcriptional regulator